MKTKSLIAGLLLTSAVAANASITLGGTSLFNADINGYTTAVYVVSNTNSFNVGLFGDASIAPDTSFAQYTALGDYTIIGTGNVNVAGGTSATDTGGGMNFNLGGNIAEGNAMGILVFNNSAGSASAPDNFLVYTNSWTVPADGANLAFTGGGPFSAAAAGAGSVAVPEPSTYAALAGFLALGCVALRRRK